MLCRQPVACQAALVLAFALLLRAAVSLHPYSGAATPPQHGDYEAQRHWMELTINLPVWDWYKSTSDNDLSYWGLDYPPVTAYQSWLCGKIIEVWDPKAVALHSSRGYETPYSKLLLRLSVAASDVIVFIPGIIAAALVFGNGLPLTRRLWILAAALLQPAAVLIDHGHFQYNNISLGFAAGAAAAIGAGWELLGSCLFCLALNHKQMSLYYAPAFLAHLLGRSMQCASPAGKAWAVARLGLVVVATFAACWAPFLGSLNDTLQVLHRLAPIRRGLFEDYVANVWCVSSLVIKWKRLLSQTALVRLTAGITLLAAAPSMLHQMRHPSPKGLLYAMANSSLAFFLFSYQVHEKSILLPLLPITLLVAEEPLLVSWLSPIAAFSMYPLLKKDGLGLAYACLLALWAALLPTFLQPQVGGSAAKSRSSRAAAGLPTLSASVAVAVHVFALTITPPTRLPFLFDAMFVSWAFLHIAGAAVYLNLRQWQLGASLGVLMKRKIA